MTKAQYGSLNPFSDHGARMMFTPHQYRFTCSICGYRVIKRFFSKWGQRRYIRRFFHDCA